LPIEKAGLPILITEDHKPYKARKVRILNGAHTSFVPGAYLAGQNIVRDCMEDKVISGFMNKTLFDEIIPTLDLPQEELKAFAASVIERFKNPFIDHELLSICLNSTYKWNARVKPSLKEYITRKGKLPKCLTASFSFYIAFFNGKELTADGLLGYREIGNNDYLIKDGANILAFFASMHNLSDAELVHAVCANVDLWGEDLTLLPGFETTVLEYLTVIRTKGSYALMKMLQLFPS